MNTGPNIDPHILEVSLWRLPERVFLGNIHLGSNRSGGAEAEKFRAEGEGVERVRRQTDDHTRAKVEAA